MTLDIYTNSNDPKRNRFRFAFVDYAKNKDLCIAVPFFSRCEELLDALEHGCSVRLVVKLGPATSDKALSKVFDHDKVQIRYLTSRFHSKLYIFGDECAFVGSSNLTHNGLEINSEINIKVSSEDQRFQILRDTFEEYWNSAVPLTSKKLETYNIMCEKHSNIKKEAESFEKDVQDEFGKKSVISSTKNMNKTDKSTKAEDNFLREYQSFLKHFQQLRDIYESTMLRKVDENLLPIRLEIDQFLSWIRKEKAIGESYKFAPIRKNDALKNFVLNQINDFMQDSSFKGIDNVTNVLYPLLLNSFCSIEKINELNKVEMFEALNGVHSFASVIRYGGGSSKAFSTFFKNNELDKVKSTIIYLLYGNEESEKRVTKCTLNEKYKLNGVGESFIKELFGWLNNEEMPVYNERTAKSMRWLGFNLN